MLARLLVIALLAVSLSACSSTKEQDGSDQAMVDGGTGMGIDQGGMGTDAYGTGVDSNGGVGPGSQADLVANVGDRVFFAYDQYDLSGEARATLDRQATWLNQYPNTRITIEGHSDERGTREYNLALGERRATSVKNYLASIGVDASRINTISYGKEQPAVVGSDTTSWAQNRRGVTRVD